MNLIEQERIIYFQNHILEWYHKYGRRFDWRMADLSNYQYIIAEVLLQRTKAETIAKFYPLFIIEFPSWSSLANAKLEAIELFLKPIGLYTQRALRLQNLAKEMVKRNGRPPADRKDLDSIPFIGQYIANAVELVIFHKPSPLLDVNMSRVLERFFGERELADIRHDPYLQELAYKVVAHVKSKKISWGILDFAALVCKPRPLCRICPMSSKCLYYCSAVK